MMSHHCMVMGMHSSLQHLSLTSLAIQAMFLTLRGIKLLQLSSTVTKTPGIHMLIMLESMSIPLNQFFSQI
ncbi:hypothetical protein CFP56_033286 [Quercus suber]|uniref:Uncharacterized protein n=1 Tax=Quercus suber TaxID=58331 RepID=A0AAW0MBG2_QUESU